MKSSNIVINNKMEGRSLDREIVGILFPGVVKNEEKALACLGGIRSISNVGAYNVFLLSKICIIYVRVATSIYQVVFVRDSQHCIVKDNDSNPIQT